VKESGPYVAEENAIVISFLVVIVMVNEWCAWVVSAKFFWAVIWIEIVECDGGILNASALL